MLAKALEPNPNEVCSGVPRDMGGCEPNQPTFAGVTCAEVGREFGSEVDRRGLDIIAGPQIVAGQSRASRMIVMTVLVTARANQYLRAQGLVAECGVDEFVAAAESQLSEPFKERVGAYLYDGSPRPYGEWLENLRRTVRVIDMGENEPFLPAT